MIVLCAAEALLRYAWPLTLDMSKYRVPSGRTVVLRVEPSVCLGDTDCTSQKY